jgi:HSP20 family protein
MALPTRRREAATSRPLAIWEPFGELDELQRRTADLMQSVWSGLRAGDGQRWVPAVDLEETGGAWIVEAELPGVRRDDVTVELADAELGVLTVRVPKREQRRPRRVAVQAREA